MNKTDLSRKNRLTTKRAKAKRKLRRARIKAGQCGQCGDPRDNTTKLCSICRRKKNDGNRDSRVRLKQSPATA